MKRSESWFDIPTRQAPIAIVLIVFNVLRSLVRTWWPFLLILVFRGDIINPSLGKQLTAVVTVLIIVFSVLQYFRFYFFISGDELHVAYGVFKKTKLDIPFDRIQSISFEQNIIHQLFNVVKLKVDTAGSSTEEFEFAALAREKADELRNFILAQKSDLLSDNTTDEPYQSATDQLILALDPGDLLKVGVSQNHLRTAGIFLAFLLGLRDNISEALGEQYVDRFDAITADVVTSGAYYVLALFVGLLVVSFFGTLIFTIIRHYNLHFWKTSRGYKMEAGLFNRREQAALDQKIQILRWVSNPLRKLFGIVSLRLYQASSTRGSGNTTISIPGCPETYLDDIQRTYFGHWLDEPTDKGSVHPWFFWRRALFIGVLPSMAFMGFYFILGNWEWMLLGISWLVVMVTYQYYYRKRWTFFIGANRLQTVSGVLEPVTKALALYKVQGAHIRQTPFQKRRQLATLILHTASGDLRIPYISSKLALQMKNYVLYKVESSQLSWM